MLSNRTQEDISHKYAETVIYYDGDPVYVHGPWFGDGQKLGAQFHKIGRPDAVTKWADVNDQRWQEGPFRLGYINDVEAIGPHGVGCRRAEFCSRMPVRRFKQGLSKENMFFTGAMNYRKALTHSGFADLLRGEFPGFAKACRDLDAKRTRIAFHRHWAVGQNELDLIELWYRNSLVGSAEAPKLLQPSAKFSYLREAFELAKR